MTLACEISDEIVPRVLNECLNEYIRLICPHLEGKFFFFSLSLLLLPLRNKYE